MRQEDAIRPRVRIFPAVSTGVLARPRVPAREARRVAAFALPGVAVLAMQWGLLRPAYIDDSFIFYRYARNWADGLGPVFNRGEWVEGFSSFLWTALLAIAAAAGIAPEDAAPVLSLALAIGCLIVVAAVARDLFDGSPFATVALPLGLALASPFAFYAATGMDAVLFAFVLLCAVVLVAAHVSGEPSRRLAWAAAAALVALVLVRAEGPAYALLIALVALAIARRRSTLPLVAAAAGATAVVLVVRLAVYGALVPAPAMAKGHATHLLAQGQLGQVVDAVRAGGHYEGALARVVTVAVVATVALAAWRRRAVPAFVWLATAAVVLVFAITAWNEGDWMPHRRLLVPALPLLLPLAAWSGKTLVSLVRPRALAGAGAVALALALTVAATGFDPPSKRAQTPYVGTELSGLGRAIAHTDPPTRVMTNLAGALPYAAGARTHVWDELGLTDIHNARHGQRFNPRFGRTDVAYVYSREFDLLVSNDPDEPRLLAGQWGRDPAKLRGYAVFTKPQWAAIPLYVVARRDSPAARAVGTYCGCAPAPLSASPPASASSP
jgi:hypothetical protein